MKKINIIEVRKKLNRLLKESRTAGKRQSCALCGDSSCAFCNSHSIPQLVLRKIAIDGKVLHPSAIVLNEELSRKTDFDATEYVDSEKGIGNSWTFHSICRSCDSKYFSDYENIDALVEPLTNRMMAEIALKNVLLQLDKRAIEVQLYSLMQSEKHNIEGKEILDAAQSLDIRDFEFERRRAQKIIDKGLKSGYHLIYWKKLPYTVPYALQSGIALEKDMNGHIVVDTANLSPDLRIEDMHIIVFPLDSESIVAVFYHKDDRKYAPFEKAFNRLTEEKKLSFINYIGLKYTENICASPVLGQVISSHERLSHLIAETLESPGFGMWNFWEKLTYSPVMEDEIPNLLSESYSIETLEGKK